MNIEDFRIKMNEFWREADLRAASLKDSHLALEMLHRFYAKLDDSEKNLANQVLAEWVMSEDENLRFDALALIGDFSIISTRSALNELALRLSMSNLPGAPFEWAKVNRLIKKLDA